MIVDIEVTDWYECTVCSYGTNSLRKFNEHQLTHTLMPQTHSVVPESADPTPRRSASYFPPTGDVAS
jgi:hypothetical protein